jgi:hypothetical protein
MKFVDLESICEQELKAERLDRKKALLKERLREIQEARMVLNKLEKRYQVLLDKDLDDIDD